MSVVSDDDATRMLATCPQQVVRVGLGKFIRILIFTSMMLYVVN